ncbi:ATP-grasp domain-containing protein [Paludisphaera mucosa]|uniref:ATP-grasp domain-containing protein n=1 Tax=Paludisphaera mucosa TaxID=3030827 RepID=A0ABT6FFP7_9BACT|nr:ATP-grasp domain-containing protein [Paludisphaera mucosa]MDG3006393.1 ATP-grasp domain-containing protein [Paludisphaera mucosa]
MSWNFDPMTPPRPSTILIFEHVTGGGMAGEPLPPSWEAEGGAMRQSLAAEFAAAGRPTRVVVALDPRLPPEEGPWETVVVDSVERLEALARRADSTLLIAPESSGVLEELTWRLSAAGCRMLGSSPSAVALTADKAALGEHLAQYGVPTPRSRVLDAGEAHPSDWQYPAVLKPVDGAGSLDTFLIERPDERRSHERRLLQEYAPGQAMSVSFLVAPGGRVRFIAVGEQEMELAEGRFAYRGGVLPVDCPEAASLAARAVESVPGLAGFVGVDLIRDAERGRIVVLEINPRPTTSCVGLGRISTPGLLADAWLAAFDDPSRWYRAMDRVERAVAAAAPVRFEACGRIGSRES